MGAHNPAVPIKVGDIRFLSGGSTVVKIIGCVDDSYPHCEVLFAREGLNRTNQKYTKYKTGQKAYISRRILYREQNRAVVKWKGEE